jgi:hypothetical protein
MSTGVCAAADWRRAADGKMGAQPGGFARNPCGNGGSSVLSPMLQPLGAGSNLETGAAVEKVSAGLAATFPAAELGGMAPILLEPVLPRHLLLSTCYLPVMAELTPCYAPVILLFCARSRFLANRLKTNGFLWIISAKIAPENGEKGDNRGAPGGRRGV